MKGTTIAAALGIFAIGMSSSLQAQIKTNKESLGAAAKAVWTDDVGSLQKMVEKGLRVDVPLAGGYTLLHHAATKNAHKCAEYLIKHGCSINARTDVTGFTALHFCALFGNEIDSKLLIAAGASIDRRSNDGLTPFDVAKQKNFPKVMAILRATNH